MVRGGPPVNGPAPRRSPAFHRGSAGISRLLTNMNIVVAALYRFVPWEDYHSHRQPLLDQLQALGIRGTLLLAREGINGTIAGTGEAIDAIVDYLRRDSRLADLEVKRSRCDQMPFKRTRVRLKKEIVTMGVDGIDPLQAVGTYVEPEQWNALISDPDVTVIDTRNDYEVAIGSFSGARNPKTGSFREFPQYVATHLDPDQHRKIAMYCTGGIRCEKSTALLKQQGFDQVYHLRGGILKYLEVIPEEDSMWQGDCFVFDRRVALGHGLVESDHQMCFACGWPVNAADRAHQDYRPGIHCPRCVGELTEDQRHRFAQRQQQLVQQQQQA